MVGVRTVWADNPRLTARGVGRKNQPWKIVLDPTLRTPLDSFILSEGMSDSTLLVTSDDVPEARCSIYRQTGAHLLRLPAEEGIIRFKTLAGPLVSRGILHVLIEGGGATAAWILKDRAVNRLELFLAPRILGASGITAVGDLGAVCLDDAAGMSLKRIRRVGEDLQITAEPK
jgi:diaminohydroxyphosphoribosylaminopyrimidine deaminase/5-amino-6-(5-phosphoribosylamino)uracil reductase